MQPFSLRPPQGCPPTAQLGALARGSLAGTVAGETRRHIEHCSDCLLAIGHAAQSDGAGAASIGEGDLLGGRYELRQCVGAGGMGVVFAAWDRTLGRKIAVKIISHDLDPDRAERIQRQLLRESRTMALLQHPNVVRVYDAGVENDAVYIVMELIEGCSLRQWTRLRHPSQSELLSVLRDAAVGLAAAHAEGIVHRDFKPDNVLVSNSGRAFVTDFGLALANHGADSDISEQEWEDPAVDAEALTQAGAIVGTPPYLAPEQYRRGPIDARADIFSFCVSVYELFAGRRPFQGSTAAALHDAIERGRVDSDGFGRLPKRVRGPVRCGLAATPGDRPASMDVLVHALSPTALSRRVGPPLLGASVALGLVGLWSSNETDTPLLCVEARRPAAPWSSASDRNAALNTIEPEHLADVDAALAGFESAWSEAVAQACERPVSDPKASAQRTLALACLATKRSTMFELVGAWQPAKDDAGLLRQRLPEPSNCLSPDLAEIMPLPTDHERAKAVIRIRQEIEPLMALTDSGAVNDQTQVYPLLVHAKELGYRPLVAEVMALRAEAYAGQGDSDAAQTAYIEAAQEAMASGHYVVAAQTWLMLAYLLCEEAQQYRVAQQYVGLAEAALEHLGRSSRAEELRVDAALRRAALAWRTADLEGGIEIIEQARQTWPDLAGKAPFFDELLAMIRLDQGHPSEAVLLFERVRERHAAERGADDPTVAAVDMSIGVALADADRYDEAARVFSRLARHQRTIFNGAHPDIAITLVNEAVCHYQRSRLEVAKQRLDEAWAVLEETGGDAYASSRILGLQSSVLFDLGEIDRAVAATRRHVQALEDLQSDQSEIRDARLGLMVVLADAGQADEALRLADRLQPEVDDARMEPLREVRARQQLGSTYTEAGHAERGLTQFVKVLDIMERIEVTRADQALFWAEAAKSHWGAEDEAGTRDLVRRVVALVDHDPTLQPRLDATMGWLTEHGFTPYGIGHVQRI